MSDLHKDGTQVSKENLAFVGGPGASVALKEPRPLKITGSVIGDKRPYRVSGHFTNGQHEEKASSSRGGQPGTTTQHDEQKRNANAETSDTFNKNSEAPETDQGRSKLSLRNKAGAKALNQPLGQNNPGSSPFKHQSQKQPKSRRLQDRIDQLGADRRASPPGALAPDGNKMNKKTPGPEAIYASQQMIVVPSN